MPVSNAAQLKAEKRARKSLRTRGTSHLKANKILRTVKKAACGVKGRNPLTLGYLVSLAAVFDNPKNGCKGDYGLSNSNFFNNWITM